MSTTMILRQQFRPVQIIKRHVSTEAKIPQSHTTLPPAKMRALISLYHQSESFITHDNLSQRIDEAFLFSNKNIAGVSLAVTLQDLQSALGERRKAPKISEWDTEMQVKPNSGRYGQPVWSSAKAAREQKVLEALYGVVYARNQALPGLEVLEESAESIRQGILDDKEEADNEQVSRSP